MVAVVFSDTARGSEGGRTFVAELRRRVPDVAVFNIDGMNSGILSKNVLSAVDSAERVIVVAESVPNPRRTTQGHEGGSVGLDMGPAQLLASILKSDSDKTVVAAFGNPYIGSGVQGIGSYVCTFSNTPVSALSLVAALFGEMPIHGHLPVSIPGMAQLGAGLDRDAMTARFGPPRN